MGRHAENPKSSKNQHFEGEKKGRVGKLDEHTLGYYRRVHENVQEGFPTEEDKELFLNNVFNQLSEEVLKVSQNQTVSGFVEQLVHIGKKQHLHRILGAVSSDWELACTDRFACYVTQTLILRCAAYLGDSADECTNEDSGTRPNQSIKELFLDVCQFLLSSLAFYMQHTYASHIIRAVLQVLTGSKVDEGVIRSRLSRQQKRDDGVPEYRFSELPVDMIEYLEKFTSNITGLPKLEDHAKNALANPVLQTLILALGTQHPDLCLQACRNIIQNTAMFQHEDGLPDLVCHDVGSHLVQQILNSASEELFSEILQEHLEDNLLPMALHPLANFVLQTLISKAHNKTQFEVIYTELKDNIEDILAHNHAGIVVKLAETAVRIGDKQSKLVKLLSKAFHCYEPEERQTKLFVLLASLMTYDMYFGAAEEATGDSSKQEKKSSGKLLEVNYHGSVLLQNLLRFGNPKVIVDGLLCTPAPDLLFMACDPKGSHVIEAFMTSSSVGQKSRNEFYTVMKGMYAELACHKNGSRTLESAWAKAPVWQKVVIAEDLVKQSGRMQGDKFGFFIWRNFGMALFQRCSSEWKSKQTGSANKRQLFEDIVSNEPALRKKKGKKKFEQVQGNDESSTKSSQDDTSENEVEVPVPKKQKSKKRSHSETVTSVQETGLSEVSAAKEQTVDSDSETVKKAKHKKKKKSK